MDEVPVLKSADELRRAGDLAGAQRVLDEALAAAAGPARGRLLAVLGRVHMDGGRNDEAIAALEQATDLLAQEPAVDRAEVWFDLGRVRRRRGDLAGALGALERATELFEGAASLDGARRALGARGKTLYAAHDWKGARDAFRRALNLAGNDPPAWRLHHAMARAYEKEGRRGDAEKSYERARGAGWTDMGESPEDREGRRPRVSADRHLALPDAAGDLTASASDSLVDHDDEAELSRAVTGLPHEDLVKLVALAGALNSALAPEPLLELLLDRAISWSGAERGYVVLCRPGRSSPAIEVRVARGREGTRFDAVEDEVSRGIVLQVVQKGAPIVTDDAVADVRLQDMQSVAERGLRSVACLPLRVRSGPPLGALYVEARAARGAFGARELGLLGALAHHVALAIERTTRYQRLADAYNETRRALEERTGNMFGIVGKARSMRQVFRLIDKLRDHTAPVLIEGETGTGKELVARAIHRSSQRRGGPFVVESCGALPEGLLEAELFGHEKGAFTGATESRRGAFERAEGGTLFLDEVSDMPVRMQALLLRTLETAEVRPIGAPAPRQVDCRIVCASREPLADMVRAGRFREDLYFRINVIRIVVPPLRDRKEDVPALAEAFLKDLGRLPSDLTPKAVEVLLSYHWPGNIRELRHALERASLLAGSGPIEPQHLDIEDLREASDEGARLGKSSGSHATGKVDFHGYLLNRRQVALLQYLRANGVATNREYVQLVNVSVPTGWRDLKDMLDKGLIRAEGQGRNTVYRLTQEAPASSDSISAHD